MAIRGFVLGVVLLALTGWCMVQETFKQTQARYKLAELSRKEGEVKKRLEILLAQEQTLRSPARLASLARENKLRLASLSSSVPQIHIPAALTRSPGQSLDGSPSVLAGIQVAAAVGGR